MAEILNDEALENVAGGNWPGKSHGTIRGEAQVGAYWCYIYQVGSGDTLSQLSYDFGLNGDYKLIARLSNITNPDRINVGQLLYIPKRV